ncbi:four helix bundle protein [Saccharicrinis carchari]|uniref:Four helix bundle protein n=1 Tax=Saccharicrinis carchari TaxID=1168039 RepID=A0A521AHZ1_SACCC|nr:four helix bundle protein [Saccharicrinis carchari]SMO34371.1 four helix bundle protein [Saccharicrinis carchari]
MKKSIAYQKAFIFAVNIVKFCRVLKKEEHEFDLANQLQRSGTSIGANLAEANGAISDADFSNKVSIAYKETLETKFWLDLFLAVEFIPEEQYHILFYSADEIARILFSILKTTRIHKKQ